MRRLAILGILLLASGALAPAQEAPASPTIQLTSPRDFQTYTDEVLVEGWILDNEAGLPSTRGIRRAWWDVLGTSLRGEIPLEADGHFAFRFPAPVDRIGLFLKVRAEGQGDAAVSESVALLRERARIDLSLRSPRDGEYYRETTSLAGALSGSVSDIQSLEWSVDGKALRGGLDVVADGSFRATIDTASLRGEVTVRVTATSRDGQVWESTARLRDGMSAPEVSLVSPSDGDEYEAQIELHGMVSLAGGEPRLEWRVRGTSLAGEPALGEDGGFSASIPTDALGGELTVDLHAFSANGREAARSVTLLEATRAVLLELTSPLDRGTYETEILVKGRAGSPRGETWSTKWVASLDVEVTGAKSLAQGIVPDPSTGQFELRIPAQELRGAVLMRIVLRDLAGNEITRTLMLAQRRASAAPSPAPSPVPALVLYAPEADALYKGTARIQGRLTDGLDQRTAGTRFRALAWEILGAERKGSIETEANGLFSGAALTEGLRGTLLLEVVAVHENGQEIAQAVVLRDDGTGPWLELSSPAAGTPYRDTVALAGLARDAAADPASGVEIARVSFELAGRPESRGEAAVDPATGAFAADVPTAELQGAQVLAVTATDRNGYETTRSVPLEDGNSQPLITLESPAEQSAYGAYLLVRGTATLGAGTGGGQIQEVEVSVASTGYELASVPVKASSAVASDGFFDIAVPAQSLHGPQKVTVLARARNGKTAEIVLGVLEGTTDLPGFAARGEDGAALLSWPPAALATRYDLTVLSDGRETKREGVSSPLELDGLKNGTLYAFRLRALLSTGEEIWSGEERAIPLSPKTLEPEVRGEYRRVRVWWQRVPGADAYEIWRSADDATDPVRLDETTELVYLDEDVQLGREYHYSIRPARYAQVLSEVVSARTTAFPAERFAQESRLEPPAGIRALTVDRSYAYLACEAGGLVVAEVRDVNRPQTLAVAPLADARDVALATLADGRRYAFVADGEDGLVAVDVSMPSEPQIVGNRVCADAQDVELISDRQARVAYVADGDSGLKVMDISVAKRPERIGSLQAGNLRTLSLRRPYLYAAGESSLVVFDVSDPTSPVKLSETPITDARGIATEARGGSIYLYVACGAEGLKILDATNPRSVKPVGQYDSTLALGVVASTHAYVADAQGGVLVIDVTDPSAPFQFDAIELGEVRSIALAEDTDGRQFAYAATSDGLRIVQILVHGRSLELGSFPTGDRGYHIELSRLGTASVYACVADHARGVHVLELEDIGSPDFHGSGFRIPTSYAYDTAVAVIDGKWHILVADAEGGLKVFDLSGMEGADEAGRARLAGAIFAADARSVTALTTEGGATYALVADRRDGLRVFDVSRPAAIRQLALVAVPGALDVALARAPEGPPMAVVGSPDGVTVVDLGTPEAPVTRGRLPGLAVRRLATLDPSLLLFAAVTDRGVLTIDCSAPAAPRVLCTYETSFGEDLFVPEPGSPSRRLYVAQGYRGISVLDASDPAQIRQVSACPGIYAVGIAGWSPEEDASYAYAVDTLRVWQIQVLVPRWLAGAEVSPSPP